MAWLYASLLASLLVLACEECPELDMTYCAEEATCGFISDTFCQPSCVQLCVCEATGVLSHRECVLPENREWSWGPCDQCPFQE